ncbi:hypothetical protein [Xanthomonas theicola]|uniref:Uncharacterized protein n=1 Tax=Xanthomonas theicola TaxID=56464 RepID=A0A2S6ZDU2_9XANT|nr:hypothetical protein [Xanthomonas theicola]PPT90319.1 hypothetical protein XthCFBP4691_12960 [Xanthomonas theicola]QNH24586.1 hypothetical protein G4Q83_07260 [Xanthomonas theicola]
MLEQADGVPLHHAAVLGVVQRLGAFVQSVRRLLQLPAQRREVGSLEIVRQCRDLLERGEHGVDVGDMAGRRRLLQLAGIVRRRIPARVRRMAGGQGSAGKTCQAGAS